LALGIRGLIWYNKEMELRKEGRSAMQEKIERIYSEDQPRWCKAIFVANVIFAGVILLMELIMWLVFEIQGLREQPLGVYLFLYMLLPTALNGIILIAGAVVMQHRWGKKELLNSIPLIQMTLICFVLSTIHHVFYVTFATFCFPVFISVIFQDRKVTRKITVLSLICVTVMAFVGPQITQRENRYLFSSYLITLAIILSANILCELMMKYEFQKDRKLAMLHRSRMEILEQLKYDQKTGLYGHTSFQNGMKMLVDEAERGNRPAVAILDIDDFKKVNDTYGHAKGDIVILELACIMREVCGDKYIAARFGGEEFAILFRNGMINDYIRTVEKIRQEIANTVFEFRESPITVSVGIAIWKEGWGTTEFFERADEALYFSKRQGKNRTTICDGDSMKPASLYRWEEKVSEEK